MTKEKVINTEKIKSYLLGKIPQDEAASIEISLIENPELEEKFIIAQESLIEDFLEGELTEKDKELFNKNFLVTDERKRQVLLIAQLKHYSKNLDFPVEDSNEGEDSEKNYFQRLVEIFTLQPAQALLGVLILGLLGGGIWFTYFNTSNNLSQLELEYAKFNQQNFEDLTKLDKYSKLILIDGKTRAISKSNELEKEKSTDNILFNIALRSESEKGETYRVDLISDNKIEFTLKEVKPYKNNFGEELRFILPKSVLEKGNYQVKVYSNKKDSTKLTFPFTVN